MVARVRATSSGPGGALPLARGLLPRIQGSAWPSESKSEAR
jgi:hypothetical protein